MNSFSMNFSGPEAFFTGMNRRKVNYETMQSPGVFPLDWPISQKNSVFALPLLRMVLFAAQKS